MDKVQEILAKGENITMRDIDQLLMRGVEWRHISNAVQIRIGELKEVYGWRIKSLERR